MIRKFNSEKLNNIINDLVSSIDKSKGKANTFHRSVLEDSLSIESNIEKISKQMNILENKIEIATKRSKGYRENLITITLRKRPNQDEDLYQEAYEKAEDTMNQLREMDKEYKYLFSERDKLDRKLRRTKSLLVETEDLMKAIGTSAKYLTNDLTNIGIQLDKKEEILLKIIEAGEIENKRVAREIHDGPAQTLTHLKIEIQLLKSLIEGNETEEAKVEINSIESHLKDAIDETRQIIYDLRPMSLDDLGIVPTLENFIKSFKVNKGLEISLRVVDDENLVNKIPEVLKLVIFRLTQEALNNIYKHANAKNVVIYFEVMRKTLRLRIIDDGKGFEVNKTFNDIKNTGNFGLIGMKERIELVDGEIKFDSKINEGTKIIVTIPWEK